MRILQFLFTLIATAIFLAGITFWVRSYKSAETAHWEKDHFVVDQQKSTRLSVTSAQGKLQLKLERYEGRIPDTTFAAPTYKYGPNGEITAVVLPPKPPIPAGRTAVFTDVAPVPAATTKQLALQTLAGFAFAHDISPTTKSYALTLPAWIVVALASIFPIGVIERFLRHRANSKKPKATRHEMFAT